MIVLGIILAAVLLIEAYAKDKNLPNVERQASFMTWLLIAAGIFRVVVDIVAAVN